MLAAIALASIASTTLASETISYSYDARGRLIEVMRSGSVNDGVRASYSYDRGDNRTSVTVTTVVVPPSLSVSDASASEGSPLQFTVVRSGSAASAIGVSYATGNGSAVVGSDYSAASGTLAFAAGEITKTVSVPTIDDAALENSETLNLTLSRPTGGASIANSQAVGTIVDNDTSPSPSFSIGDASVIEGGTLTFTVTKSGVASSSYSVSFASAGGSAVSGADFTAASGTLTFAAADTAKTITIATIDDALIESTETMSINISAATGGAAISDTQGMGTINDNDSAGNCNGVSFAVGDAYGTEGDVLFFTVTKSGAATSNCSVAYATANGTAMASTDYDAISGALAFAANETSKTIGVQLLDGGLIEPAETFFFNLSNPSFGATIQDAQGVGTIADGAACPTCLVEDPPAEAE